MCSTFKHSPWLYFFPCLLLYQIQLSNWTELNWIHDILPYHQHFHLTEVNIFSCSEWLALPISILFLRACVLSYVLLSAILWTIACQDPLFMQFSKKEYWSICHFLLQGIFPTQGSNLSLLHWQADSLTMELPGKSVPSSIYKFKKEFLAHCFLMMTHIYLIDYLSFFPKQMQNHCRDNVHCAELEFKTLTMIWKEMVGDVFCKFCKSWARISAVMEAGQRHHCCYSQLFNFLCRKIYITTLLPICHTTQTIMWTTSCHRVPTFISAFNIHRTRFC